MRTLWTDHRLVLTALVLLSWIAACGTTSKATPLRTQAIAFAHYKVSLLAIGLLTHKFSLGPDDSGTLSSECYTHRSETMEQVVCWTRTTGEFDPNLEEGFRGILDETAKEENLPDAIDYSVSPRMVSGLHGIEATAHYQGIGPPTTIRSLIWSEATDVWHVTLFFVTGNPEGPHCLHQTLRSSGRPTLFRL
jgi:hypothetical protein